MALLEDGKIPFINGLSIQKDDAGLTTEWVLVVDPTFNFQGEFEKDAARNVFKHHMHYSVNDMDIVMKRSTGFGNETDPYTRKVGEKNFIV